MAGSQARISHHSAYNPGAVKEQKLLDGHNNLHFSERWRTFLANFLQLLELYSAIQKYYSPKIVAEEGKKVFSMACLFFGAQMSCKHTCKNLSYTLCTHVGEGAVSPGKRKWNFRAVLHLAAFLLIILRNSKQRAFDDSQTQKKTLPHLYRAPKTS